jgi:hypothetical protein
MLFPSTCFPLCFPERLWLQAAISQTTDAIGADDRD